MIHVTPTAFLATRMIQKFLTSALFAGAGAGFAAGLLQLVFVQPVLLHAELYETGQLVHFGAASNVSAHQDLGEVDIARDGLNVLFTMFLFTGYGLILLPLMVLASEHYEFEINSKTGLIWGVAGFVVINMAPGFSMAPEVPGVATAEVSARQIWWFATVACAGLALWLIAFGRGWPMWLSAIALLIVPHAYGAPEPEVFLGTVPTEIGALFAARALGTSMAAWAILGLFAGHFWQSSPQT